MAIYIQLLTLTPEGRSKSLEDPGSVLRAQQGIAVPDVQELDLYGVLGDYDFVNIVQAKNNESVARYSLGQKRGQEGIGSAYGIRTRDLRLERAVS